MQIVAVSRIGMIWEMVYAVSGEKWAVAYTGDEYKHYYDRGRGFIPSTPSHAPAARFILAALIGSEYGDT